MRDSWDNLSRTNRILLIAGSVCSLIALIAFVSWASTPEYVMLFSGLSPQDETAIVDKLREANVPIRQHGATIEVPSTLHDEWVARLLAQDLPHQGGSVLDTDPFKDMGGLQTQQVETEMIRHRKETQVGRMIAGMQPVANASVRFAPANDSPYSVDRTPPSAAVVVNHKTGQTLSAETVRAIVKIVQMSFTGLTEKSITVVEGTGALLFDGTHNGVAANGNERLRQQQAVAESKRVELQTALDNTLGPGRAVVLVHAELNPDNEETETRTSEPGAVTSRTEETENLRGKGNMRGQAAGASANVSGPGGAGIPAYTAATSQDGSQYMRSVSNRTSDVSYTLRKIQKGPGHIEKLSVSALIDSNKVPAEQVAEIEKALRTAISADASEGSGVRLVSTARLPFDKSDEEKQGKVAAAARSSENTVRLFATLVPVGLMLLCLILLARALRRSAIPVRGVELALAGGAPLGALAAASGGGREIGDPAEAAVRKRETPDAQSHTLAPIGIPVGAHEPRTFEVFEEAFDANLESIVHLARTNPRTVALLVKSWLREDGH